MRISGGRLAAALAARLNPVVPRPFSVRSEGPTLIVDHPEGWGSWTTFDPVLEDEPPPTPEEAAYYADNPEVAGEPRTAGKLAETFALSWLNALSTDFSEARRTLWPPLARPSECAEPGTRLDGANLHLWYGDESAPVIAFPPIALGDLDPGR